ncbi:ECF transporter S component [Romboutsia sedimentorum]|uniref:ECF transporter S component n=1 Tax=Romboutsia sedimentorum TaxID=1368474 RepID=A0ABT7E842_9FIRM|nr:ECF transporter S component [Romboutsia sedimentorum]MDK2563101.1 ECF transporter S component [Romboutsia sedimentorum]MDK2586178.1 ECF transporter S component [Romboutsia sedimentorum]
MRNKKIVLSGLFIAFGIIVPMIFHTVNLAGSIFLPMHIPVLIAGFLLGPLYGGIVGALTPILSSFMTGMPPLVPVMPIMVFELCAYGIITGFLFGKTKNTYISLVGAMIGGRLFAVVGAFLVSLTIAPQVSPLMFVFGSLAKAIPGMIVQIVFIPILVKFMTKNTEISKALA